MSLTAIVANTVAVLKAAGFREADNRRPIEEQSEMGSDGCFQVSLRPVVPVLPRHAISDNVRSGLLTVRAVYFVGGGDAGGAEHGGDRFHVNARGNADQIRMAQLLENPLAYGAQASGLRKRTLREFSMTVDTDRAMGFDLNLRAEWEQSEDSRAVSA